MREIKFRGKRVDNSECVYGYYSVVNINHGIWSRFESEFPQWYQVHPESIGQFTGLTAKNGTEIYEGDILQVAGNRKYEVCFLTEDQDEEIICAFGLRNPDIFLAIDDYAIKQGVIIGNVYENPELIK